MSIQMYPTCFTFSCCDILADDNKTRCCPKMARNTTGPPAIIRLEAAWRHGLACAGEAASSFQSNYSSRSVTDDARVHHCLAPIHCAYIFKWKSRFLFTVPCSVLDSTFACLQRLVLLNRSANFEWYSLYFRLWSVSQVAEESFAAS